MFSYQIFSVGSLSHIPHFLNPDTQHLIISGNQIIKLESGLTYYSELLTLNMSFNQISSLGMDQFMSQTNLLSLDLSSNLVSKLRVGAFNGLESLTRLNMRENRIERLSSAVFTGLYYNILIFEILCLVEKILKYLSKLPACLFGLTAHIETLCLVAAKFWI